MQSNLTREQALDLLKTYNKEPFHIQHALTVEGVMRWYANELGYGDEADYWATVGLLHDIDFENWPEEHCKKAPELLRQAGVGEDMIRSICSHAYGLCSDVEPVHEMEKVLFEMCIRDRHRHGIPKLRHLPPPDRPQKRRVRPPASQHPQG